MIEEVKEYAAWRIKVRIVTGIIAIFLVSLLFSCQELRYMISGKTIEATKQWSRVETVKRNGELTEHRVVGYAYTDKDTTRQQIAEVPMDWAGGSLPTVTIQYIPGREMSRIKGQTHMGWVIVFFASLAAGAIGVFILVRSSP